MHGKQVVGVRVFGAGRSHRRRVHGKLTGRLCAVVLHKLRIFSVCLYDVICEDRYFLQAGAYNSLRDEQGREILKEVGDDAGPQTPSAKIQKGEHEPIQGQQYQPRPALISVANTERQR